MPETQQCFNSDRIAYGGLKFASKYSHKKLSNDESVESLLSFTHTRLKVGKIDGRKDDGFIK